MPQQREAQKNFFLSVPHMSNNLQAHSRDRLHPLIHSQVLAYLTIRLVTPPPELRILNLWEMGLQIYSQSFSLPSKVTKSSLFGIWKCRKIRIPIYHSPPFPIIQAKH
jgi:hypothetical protein